MKTEFGFRAYAEWVVRYRLAVIFLILGMTVFLASRIGSLKVDMDPDIWAPQAHPFVKATKDLERAFGGRNITVIGIVPKSGDVYQPAILAKIQRIQTGIELIPEALRQNILSLAAHKVKDIRGADAGMTVRPMLERMPSGPDDIARIRRAVELNPIYRNALVADDGSAIAVIADFRVSKEDPSYTKIYQAIRAVVDPERDASVTIHLGGLPIEMAWFERHMMKMPMLFGIALLIIMAIQYMAFRSLQGMFLPILTALLSVVWGMGLMGLLGVHMDGMNTTTPILIMAVAAGHGIQILKRYYEEYRALRQRSPEIAPARANQAAVVEALTRVGPAMLTAGLIAVITFFSVAGVGISVVRNFGVFAGSGVLAALILEMTLIPAIRSLLPAPKRDEAARENQTDHLDRLLHALADKLSGGGAPWLLGMGLFLILVAFAGIWQLRADNSTKRYNLEGTEVRRDDQVLNAKFGGTSSIFFLIEGPQDSLKDPLVLQGIANLQAYLDQQPLVGKTQSLADMVKRMNQAMHGDDPAFNKVPDDRNLIAQYLFLYTLSGDPQDFDSYVDNDYAKAALWVYLKEDSTAYAEALFRGAKTIIAQNFPPGISVRIGGSLPQTVAINEVLMTGKFWNMLQMGLVVFLLASIALRSWVGGLFVLMPLVLIVLANFGIMGWLGIPLDMGTATSAAMAMGVGADYELYLLYRFREELALTGDIGMATRNSLSTSGKAVLLVALSVAGGYAVLLASGFGFYLRLAIMVIATMTVSAFSALLFLRATMMIFRPRFVFGDERAEQPGSFVTEGGR